MLVRDARNAVSIAQECHIVREGSTTARVCSRSLFYRENNNLHSSRRHAMLGQEAKRQKAMLTCFVLDENRWYGHT